MKRILTALVLIPIVVYTVLWADYWILLAVVIAVSLLCYREYDTIAAGYGFGAPGVVGYGAGILLLVWQGESWPLIMMIAIVALVMAMRAEDLAHSLPRAALLLMGVIYIFGCWKAALPLHTMNHHWLMFALLLNWMGDTGAYYVGRFAGRHKLAPRVSPKKTWEGAVASIVFAVAVGWAYLVFFIPSIAVPEAIALSMIGNVAGQLGDLAESAIKRGASVKDSSTLLPGHGGLLDRVDGTLFTLPVLYVCLRLMA
jgi:phosphatidate cytidylyltransferase